jgi:[NiFe] hydrogenase diaphorase moiety large subunit
MTVVDFFPTGVEALSPRLFFVLDYKAHLTESIMEQYESIINHHPRDASRLLEIMRDVQAREGHIPEKAVAAIARHLRLSEAEVRGVVTFYHFFSLSPRGRYAVYLNTSITSWMAGRAAVARAFEEESGCLFGEVTADGQIGLFPTSCIGMNDQEPSAIINGVVFTRLTPQKARHLVLAMKTGRAVQDMVTEYGDGANQSELVRAMVSNNIRRRGPVVFGPFAPGSAVRAAVARKRKEVIQEIKEADLLGRGGAGFPTGLKWEFCRREKAGPRYVVCNADEGEPGTFKDRVLLTELPQLVFEGMTVAGYAIGAEEGVLYLRSEYAYLRPRLEAVLEKMRRDKILGREIAGHPEFRFDITIASGAGSYVCGEESALLESTEGRRGEPRNRPPFPVQIGYRDCPTTVNNVETLCTAAKIIVHGAPWFRSMGTPKSAGTKLLSISGDCERPGLYELEFGLTVQELLDIAGARDAFAVQVGGPSGTCISRQDFRRRIAFEDLATGGSVIIFGPWRNLFEIVKNFMDFFIEESCGWCTPCRVGNSLLKQKLEKITAGRGTARDLQELEAWGKLIRAMSRCGLGQTSPNPILSTLQNFRELYEAVVRPKSDFTPDFDLGEATLDAARLAGRRPELEETSHE